MTRAVKLIINQIVEELKAEKNLLSLTLVGSFLDASKKLEKFNDIDLVFIYKDIQNSNLDKLNKLQRDIKKRYSSKEIGITSTFKICPIKIISKKPKTIMLHFLVYSKENYLKYESIPTRFSFQHYKPLLGKSLKNINLIKKLTFKDLLNNIDGIPAMKEWIIKKEGGCIEPIRKNVRFTNFKLKNEQYLEVIFYSVLNLASNMVRVKKGYVDFDLNTFKKFKENFAIDLNNFPYEIFLLKNKLRKNHHFTQKEINELKRKALTFISQCEFLIKTNL